jgi:hypothetical protein
MKKEEAIQMANRILAGEKPITKMVKVDKYTFPALFKDGKMFTLDGKTPVNYPIYHKYDKGDGSELSQQEKDYNFRLTEVTEQHNSEIESLKETIKKLDIKYQACSNILERLRKSLWSYIAFRLKI